MLDINGYVSAFCVSASQTGSRICGRYSAMRDGQLFTSVVIAFIRTTSYNTHFIHSVVSTTAVNSSPSKNHCNSLLLDSLNLPFCLTCWVLYTPSYCRPTSTIC